MCQKGKRLRPLVSFLIAKTCGGASEATYRAAVILELLHTASLVHDDVLDESKLRRGKRTINDIWDNKTAILFGDYIYGVCLHLIETKEDFELLDIYSKIARELPQGKEGKPMMTVSEVSRLTGVSIRTLQYYDKIGFQRTLLHRSGLPPV